MGWLDRFKNKKPEDNEAALPGEGQLAAGEAAPVSPITPGPVTPVPVTPGPVAADPASTAVLDRGTATTPVAPTPPPGSVDLPPVPPVVRPPDPNKTAVFVVDEHVTPVTAPVAAPVFSTAPAAPVTPPAPVIPPAPVTPPAPPRPLLRARSAEVLIHTPTHPDPALNLSITDTDGQSYVLYGHERREVKLDGSTEITLNFEKLPDPTTGERGGQVQVRLDIPATAERPVTWTSSGEERLMTQLGLN